MAKHRKVVGIRYLVGPSPKGQCWVLRCQNGHDTIWYWGGMALDPRGCSVCGSIVTEWVKSYCPSTHGAASPYEPTCSMCGANVTREEIVEVVEVPNQPAWILRLMGFCHA